MTAPGPAADGHAHEPHGHDHDPHAHDHGPASGAAETAAEVPTASAADGHEHHDHGAGGHDHGAGDHDHPSGLLGRLKELVAPHSHDAADSVDSALESSAKGIRALKVSLVVLGLTAVLQALVVVLTGSVALLGDTLHNVSDALTAVPLAIAFTLGRRPPNRRYTYGYGRAEDLAGVVIVVVILASAAVSAYEAAVRLVHPAHVDHLLAVAVAGVVGFAGNELVAQYRIRVGREIGSAALVADGLHARTDGYTSLAVVVGAVGVALGFQRADPVVGLLISIAILVVLKDAARTVYRRLMDAVDEPLLDHVERVLRATPGVRDLGDVRLRWIGHDLRAEAEVVVDGTLSLVDGHAVADDAMHRLVHEVPRLTSALVHADPEGAHTHEVTAHHRRTV